MSQLVHMDEQQWSHDVAEWTAGDRAPIDAAAHRLPRRTGQRLLRR